MENSVDSDQLDSQKPADIDLTYIRAQYGKGLSCTVSSASVIFVTFHTTNHYYHAKIPYSERVSESNGTVCFSASHPVKHLIHSLILNKIFHPA